MPTLEQPVALKAALRHDATRRAVEVNGRVSIAEFKDRLGVSEVTIREDLKHIESHGVLTPIRGGAVASRNGARQPASRRARHRGGPTECHLIGGGIR